MFRHLIPKNLTRWIKGEEEIFHRKRQIKFILNPKMHPYLDFAERLTSSVPTYGR